MPHTFPILTEHAQRELGAETQDYEKYFLARLAELVAEVFNQITGESLQAGRDSLAYEPVLDDTMPVDLSIVVVAWWTEQRAPHFETLRQALIEAIAHVFQFLRTAVKLNVFGAPSDEEVDPFDFAKGPPNVAPPVRQLYSDPLHPGRTAGP